MTELRHVADARIAIEGEELLLVPERAVYWPSQQTLLVADAHFGKSTSPRGRGPGRDGTAESLARLDAILARHAVRRIVFLGDFFHDRNSKTEATLARLAAWREVHDRLELVLVRGNHDGRAGDPPAELRVRVVPEPFRVDPFSLCHEPSESKKGFAIAGHLHPAIVLRGRGDDRSRLPCFWVASDYAVLPAFGDLDGTYLIQRRPGDQVFVVADEHVLPV
ncbi:MAG: ligase-associated DNA damage response endonuclease PdeM [Burkholderiales bacterium]|jgi:DNA ligase-associated metallophosphoesterase|nr:ligase-associated DNA damage response endonuclease PdeM [Burkholderiales bacterium]